MHPFQSSLIRGLSKRCLNATLGVTFLIAATSAFVSPHLAGAQAIASFSPSRPLITENVDDARLTTLRGNTRPEARAENDRGKVAADLRMGDLILVLHRSAEQQAAADAYAASLYDSKSPNFHHWLTPEQIGEDFGPAQSDVDAVTSWLQNHGFSIDDVSKDRLTIRFSGIATQVQSTFHTEIHNLQVKNKEGILESHIANMSDPQIPSALTPVVVGVKALHNFFPRPHHVLGSKVTRDSKTGEWKRIPSSTSTTQALVPVETSKLQPGSPRPLFGVNVGTIASPEYIEDLAPYDFATIYNVLPLWTTSTPTDGTGQKIAIAGTSNITLSDIQTFRTSFGLPTNLPANTPTVVITNSDPGVCPTTDPNYPSCLDDLVENSLDVEWSGAVAKNASIILVTSDATTATTDNLYLSESYIVKNVTVAGSKLYGVGIMNVSYGECELGLGTAGNASYSTLWNTAYMEGLAVFTATGDSGSASCDGSNNTAPYTAEFGLSVSGIASTPYDTSVGGTDFNWGSTPSPYWSTSNDPTTRANALGYIPEIPWDATCTNPLLLAEVNSQLGKNGNLTAAEACDDFYNGTLYNQSPGDLAYFVNTIGGGGGKSACTDGDQSTVASCTTGYPKPSWQSGVTGIPADGRRDVPDVSFFASSGFDGSAYLICVTGTGAACSYVDGVEPVGQEVGGTSVASPIMAGVMALINQKSGSVQGNPNTELYKLASKESYSSCTSESVKVSSACVFNDVDTGTNAMPCAVGSTDCTGSGQSGDQVGVLNGYSATVGYDLASGLGSMNVANLVATAFEPAVTLSPTSLTFAGTLVGSSAATQSVTLTNSGDGPLSVSTVSVSGTNASSFTEKDTCAGTSVAAASTCTITVTFTPTTTGTLSASISIADNASNTPQTVSLAGTGTIPVGTFTFTASNPAAVSPGSTTPSTINVTPTNGYAGTIAFTCSVTAAPTGDNTLANPTCSALSINAGTATTGTLTVNTTAPSNSAVRALIASNSTNHGWLTTGGAALACFVLFGIPARKRKWRAMLSVLILFAGLGVFGAISGCGGGGNTVTQPVPGTTAGAYTITVTGTDATNNITTTATFTLTVN
jgi:subtilase family serine protease